MTNTNTIILACAIACLGIITIKRLLEVYRNETIVWENQLSLHFKNGFLAGPLAPGKHVFFGRGNSVISYDRRQREIVVKGQDLLTADGVTVNVNVAVHFSLSDAAKLFTSAGSPKQVLSSAVQLALRELVGATSIERFLESESSYDKPLTSRATSAGAAVGLAVERVEIRDVIPGGVLRERSEALAEAERARGKVASLRALATPTRILERNPNQFRPRYPQQIAHGGGSNACLRGGPDDPPSLEAANP